MALYSAQIIVWQFLQHALTAVCCRCLALQWVNVLFIFSDCIYFEMY